MSNLTKGLILVVAVVAIGAGLVVWKSRMGGSGTVHASFNSISKPEIEMLLADVAKTNPAILKRLAEDPEMKKQQVKNLKELLAFASQAKKDGLADSVNHKQELESIRSEILAVNYDKELNKDKGPMPAFGFITEDQVKAYWDEGSEPASNQGFLDRLGLGGPVETRTHEQEFNDFLGAKLELMKASSPEMKDREISEEERTQAKDIFAKIRLYKREYEQKVKSGELGKEFVDKANLQVKLQQAQFLARLYAEKLADTAKVSDEEVAKYIAEHPELDPATKKAEAQKILDRAIAGEDFAALANEFSQDPGNKGTDGTPQGGIYKDIGKGRMVAPFEEAALALEPGQIAPNLVETDFGFHIIKLERKLGPGGKKAAAKPGEDPADSGETYDARHILISTGVKDAENPMGRETPVKDFVRTKLETEKEKKVLDDIVAANNVSVPEDFTVPAVTEEQIQQMRQKQQQQQQMQMPPPDMQPGEDDAEPAAKPDAKKPASKK
ncbi:MAG: peptidylprolyl isomerase [Pyrinomonadaceae bacterium]